MVARYRRNLGSYSTSASPTFITSARPRRTVTLPTTGSSTASISAGRFSSSSGVPAAMHASTCLVGGGGVVRGFLFVCGVGLICGLVWLTCVRRGQETRRAPRCAHLVDVARRRLLQHDEAVWRLARLDPADALGVGGGGGRGGVGRGRKREGRKRVGGSHGASTTNTAHTARTACTPPAPPPHTRNTRSPAAAGRS